MRHLNAEEMYTSKRSYLNELQEKLVNSFYSLRINLKNPVQTLLSLTNTINEVVLNKSLQTLWKVIKMSVEEMDAKSNKYFL